MRVIALGSVKASPGVTTTMLACASAWPAGRGLVLVDADPDGGDLATRIGVPIEPGLTSFAATARHPLAPLEGGPHVQNLAHGLQVLVAPPGAAQASRALEILGDRLGPGLAAMDDRDVLVDCGRLRPGSPAGPILAHADVVVLVARPRLDELQHVAARLRQLGGGRIRPTLLLLIGDRPYPAAEVANSLQTQLIATLPVDPTAADTLNGRGGSRERLQRTGLIRTAREVAEALVASLTTGSPPHREPAVSRGDAADGGRRSREPSVSAAGHGEPSGWARAIQRSPSRPATGGADR